MGSNYFLKALVVLSIQDIFCGFGKIQKTQSLVWWCLSVEWSNREQLFIPKELKRKKKKE